MTSQEAYYNTFYQTLSRIDERSNDVSKIAPLIAQSDVRGRVLDIGCGHGAVGKGLIPLGYEVHGMEINREALASVAQRGMKPIEWDITRPFQLDQRYELVLLLDVLEHVFDPVALLVEARKVLAPRGRVILSVPLYFDLVDRLRILLTGRIVSYDNMVYGRELYERFKSYNYDHIRFFRASDVYEMLELAGLRSERVQYGPIVGLRHLPRLLAAALGHPSLVKRWPNLLAHSLLVRAEAQ